MRDILPNHESLLASNNQASLYAAGRIDRLRGGGLVRSAILISNNAAHRLDHTVQVEGLDAAYNSITEMLTTPWHPSTHQRPYDIARCRLMARAIMRKSGERIRHEKTHPS